MRRCAVMQPSFLPWAGFFNLIMNSDVFIFLDDVQYSKNTFFNRNRYPSHSTEGFSWLTVPVRRESSTQLFSETVFAEDGWRRKHLITIRQNYGRHLAFEGFYPVLERNISDLGLNTLSKLNISLIRDICAYLGIRSQFHIASELKVDGQRSERLLKFCRMFDCAVYLSPGAAVGYITEDDILPASDVHVVYQKYECKEYKQRVKGAFLPSMSIIDIAFRMTPEAVKQAIYQEVVS